MFQALFLLRGSMRTPTIRFPYLMYRYQPFYLPCHLYLMEYFVAERRIFSLLLR